MSLRILVVLSVGVFAVSLAQGTTILTVAADGSKEYKTVQSAVNALPSSGGEIQIWPGTYKEVVNIAKPNVQLRGQTSTASQIVITYDNAAANTGSTSKSATVTVTNAATNFFADNLTIQNTYDTEHGQDGSGAQAVALYVYADRSVFRNVRIIGRQDTLLADRYGCYSSTNCVAARQYFYGSYIEGNVDFIFGGGATVFDSCTIQADEHDNAANEATITAQNRQYSSEYSGYVFWNSTLNSPSGMTALYLGRPWTAYARVVYINTVMNASINTAGWIEWSPGSTNYLSTAYLGEYGSTGTGATGYNSHARESHAIYLTSSQANSYAPATYLAGSDGWNPTTIY
jgi:pectin methylesterase-like acyl-CoA thioesterase